MKIGQQSTANGPYTCAVLTLNTACEQCPIEYMGMYLMDERVLPADQPLNEWPECQGSSSSEPPWYLDVYPRPAGGNKLCVLNISDPFSTFHECISYADYNQSIHEMVSGPYMADECEGQCPPTQPFMPSPRCIPLSSYDESLHEICGGPYYSQNECGTGCNSSSSSSSGPSNPTCEPTVSIITLPDGSVVVEATCSDQTGSSTSEGTSSDSSENQSSSGSQCSLGPPPPTEDSLCPDGTIKSSKYYLPDFKNCSWRPITYTVKECEGSSSSCEGLKRHCLYSNLYLPNLSFVFSQEDKPPPCTYQYYCLPEGCVYLCEDETLGTPISFCVDDCCGPGVCDKDCESTWYANCIVCGAFGGLWFYNGEGWEQWYEDNCGCCCASNGVQTECIQRVKKGRCNAQGGLLFSIECNLGEPENCVYTWKPGLCEPPSSSSSSLPSNYICDYSSGCIENPWGDWGMTIDECQNKCGKVFTCGYSGCQQNTYYSEIQTWEFSTQKKCEDVCIERYYCDVTYGCTPQGKGTSGLSSCSSCVVVDKVCDYYDPCKVVWGVLDPENPPPAVIPCPTGCDRHYQCTTGGCIQDYYYTPQGYTSLACDQACVETFYCDSGAGCMSFRSEYYTMPYPDRTSCEVVCHPRYFCEFTSGCMPSGYGVEGIMSCEEVISYPGCVERFECNPDSGCLNAGWGVAGSYDLSCDSTSCIHYFECVEGVGCVRKYIKSLIGIPIGAYATMSECSEDCLVSGCTNPGSPNYNQNATCDDGTCITCCNQNKCVVDDESPCKGSNCNSISGGGGGGYGFGSGEYGSGTCCDSGCLSCVNEAGYQTGDDCSPTFQGSFTATGCDGGTIVYSSCYECGGWYRVENAEEGPSIMSFTCLETQSCGGSVAPCFKTYEDCMNPNMVAACDACDAPDPPVPDSHDMTTIQCGDVTFRFWSRIPTNEGANDGTPWGFTNTCTTKIVEIERCCVQDPESESGYASAIKQTTLHRLDPQDCTWKTTPTVQPTQCYEP